MRVTALQPMSPSPSGRTTFATSSFSSTSSRSSVWSAICSWAVLSPQARRRGESAGEPRRRSSTDDDLEGRRLERVLGWALIFAAVFAVALLVYWLREPTRQDQSDDVLQERLGRTRRGAVRQPAPARRTTRRSRCSARTATAATAAAGRRPQIIDPDGPDGAAADTEYASPGRRRRSTPSCCDSRRTRSTQIITYGRPGTPMQPCGVAGRRPEERADDRRPRRVHPVDPADARPVAEERDRRTLVAAREGRRRPGRDGRRATSPTPPKTLGRSRTRNVVEAARRSRRRRVTPTSRAQCNDARGHDQEHRPRRRQNKPPKARRCRTFLTAYADEQTAAAALDVGGRAWRDSRADVSDGQLLFETYCARCHTQGWSIFDPTAPRTARRRARPAGGGGGQGGGIGFNLRDGDTERRFGPGATKGTAASTRSSTSSSTGSEAEQAVRQRRHRLRQDARLRQHAHRRSRSSRSSRTSATASTTTVYLRAGDHRADDDRLPSRPRRRLGAERTMACWSGCSRQEGGPQEPLEPDDPRRPHRALRRRAVLRFGRTCCSARTSARRLGFLVAAACLTGFLRAAHHACGHDRRRRSNSPNGRPPRWKVIEVVASPADVEDRRGAQHRRGRHAGRRRGASRNSEPAIDAALVPRRRSPTSEAAGAAVRDASVAVDRLPRPTSRASSRSRRRRRLEEPLLARRRSTRPWRSAHARTDAGRGSAAADAGVRPADADAVRHPGVRPRLAPPAAVVVYFFTSLILFGLFLLGLHWYEKDAARTQEGRIGPASGSHRA